PTTTVVPATLSGVVRHDGGAHVALTHDATRPPTRSWTSGSICGRVSGSSMRGPARQPGVLRRLLVGEPNPVGDPCDPCDPSFGKIGQLYKKTENTEKRVTSVTSVTQPAAEPAPEPQD